MTYNVEKVRFSAEFDIAEFLKENNYIEQHVYESALVDRKHYSLFEARGSGDPRIVRDRHFKHFKNIWNDFDTYPDHISVWDALFPDNTALEPETKKKNLQRMIAEWVVGIKTDAGKNKDHGIPEGRELKAFTVAERQRKVQEYLSNQARSTAEDVDIEDSIDPGRRGKKSQTGNIEKASDLIPGELYADMTRIPKRQWGGWWRKLVQQKTSVEPPKQAITSLRKWTRHFILGYQLEENLSYEIWYNSQDGTFSVHDRWGNPVRGGTRIPVMKDALNLLFQNVAQYAPSDIDFFNQPSNELKRVNIGLEKEGKASEEAAKQKARQMRKDKEDDFAVFDFSEEEQKRKAQQSRSKYSGGERRRNTSVPDSMDKKFAPDEEEAYDEYGEKSRKETEGDFGEENNFDKELSKEMERIQKKQKAARDSLRRRADSAERREREKEGDDPANSQGSNTDGSQAAVNDERPMASLPAPSVEGDSEKEDYKAKPHVIIDGTVISNPIEITNQVKKAAINPNLDFGDIAFKNMPKKLISDLEKLYAASQAIETKTSGRKDIKGIPSLDKSEEEKEAEEEAKKSSKEQNKKSNENSPKRNISLDQEFYGEDDDFDISGDFGVDDDLVGGMGDNPFESLVNEQQNTVEDTGVEGGVDLGDPEENPLYDKGNNQRVMEVREQARRSPYTRQMINNMFFEGLVKEYYQTRSRQYKSVLEKVTDWFKMFRGRNEKIKIPTNIVSRTQRIKGFFSGAQARSDFIIGLSIRDEVNFEIWYVQEISQDGKSQYASFYVYDVTAEKIVKANIPYYRNALTVIINKIGK